MSVAKTLPKSVCQNTLRRRMSPEEYAEYMGVSRVTVYRLLRDNRIDGAVKIGRQWRIDPDSVIR